MALCLLRSSWRSRCCQFSVGHLNTQSRAQSRERGVVATRQIPLPLRAPACGLPPCPIRKRLRRDSSHRSANASPDRSLLGADASRLRRWLLEQCAKAGFKPNIVEEVPSSDGVFDLVQDGIGVAILPGEACDGMPPDLQCCPISNLEPVRGSGIPAGGTHTVQKVVAKIPNSLRHFGQRRKIFSSAVRPAKRPVVPIASSAPGLIAGGHQIWPEWYWTRNRLRVNLSHDLLDSGVGQPYVIYEGLTMNTILMNRLDGGAVGPVKVLVSSPVYSRRCWPSPPEPLLRASPSTMVPSWIGLEIQIQHVREWRAQTAATNPQCEELSHGSGRQAKNRSLAFATQFRPPPLRTPGSHPGGGCSLGSSSARSRCWDRPPTPASKTPASSTAGRYMRVRRCRNNRKADSTMHRASADAMSQLNCFRF